MNGKFKEGTIIKGRELKGYTLCKILSEDMCMKGFQYKIGKNVDVKRLAVKGSCKAGLYFCLIKDICEYLDYGTKLAVVKVADNEDVYVDRGKFRTHRLEIQKMMPLVGQQHGSTCMKTERISQYVIIMQSGGQLHGAVWKF